MLNKSFYKCFSVFLSLSFMSFNSMSQDLRNMPPTPPQALIHLMNIVTGEEKQWTWEEMNVIAQRDFLRPKGKERWEIVLNPAYESKKEVLMPLLKELGLLDEVLPTQKNYDYIVVNGATVSRMRARLEWLQKQWAGGVRAKKVLFFIGERPLDPRIEGDRVLYPNGIPSSNQRPKTEAEAAPILWDQVVTLPQLKSMPVEYVVASMIKDPVTKKESRPNTIETIQAWLLLKQKPGTILSISNNPYIPYQHRVFVKAFEHDPDFTIETVGPAAGDDSITNHLDNIALCIYTQVKGA
jgi:hypothetical protein